MAQIHALIQKLQRIAKDAGHPRPLLIGIDQENGTFFPGTMLHPIFTDKTYRLDFRVLRY